MATLHLLSHSPFGDDRLGSCLRLLGGRDALLLCGDAVYALVDGSTPCQWLDARAHGRVFVLEEDAVARGLLVPEWAEAVDYPAFVTLSVRYDKVNTWL